MVAMLEEVVQFGTGVRAKELGRPSGGKTGTTNDFTDAWYIGFTPQLTTGVWVGNDDKRISSRQERNGRASRAAYLAGIHAAGNAGRSIEDFPNVIPLEQLAGGKELQVDTADTAPPTDAAEQGLTEAKAPESQRLRLYPQSPVIRPQCRLPVRSRQLHRLRRYLLPPHLATMFGMWSSPTNRCGRRSAAGSYAFLKGSQPWDRNAFWLPSGDTITKALFLVISPIAVRSENPGALRKRFTFFGGTVKSSS